MTKDGDNVTVTCSSNHLTSFAVLVDVGGAKVKQHIVRVHTCQKLNMFTVEPVLNNFLFSVNRKLNDVSLYVVTVTLIIATCLKNTCRFNVDVCTTLTCTLIHNVQIVDKYLQIVSYIAISVSIACLFLTIVFFASIGYV